MTAVQLYERTTDASLFVALGVNRRPPRQRCISGVPVAERVQSRYLGRTTTRRVPPELRFRRIGDRAEPHAPATSSAYQPPRGHGRGSCTTPARARHELDAPDGGHTWANDINDGGTIVGMSGSELAGFIYRNGSFTTIQDSAAFQTYVNAINNAGEIAGWVDIGTGEPDTRQLGFVWREGTFERLPVPG